MKTQPTVQDILHSMVIAIDGPSGSGKTTTAREVAHRLKLRHLDTGAMYRAVTHRALQNGAPVDDEEEMARIADAAQIAFLEEDGGAQRVLLDDEDVSQAIRSAEVTASVSMVSSHGRVREAMVRRQRALADDGGVVLEGRDIGSVVLPSADIKIYLDASIDVRSRRRFEELRERGTDTDLASVRKSLERRDDLDSSREVSPLVIPVGAKIVDTSGLTIEEQVKEVLETAQEGATRMHGLSLSLKERRHVKKRRFLYRATQWSARLVMMVLWGLRLRRKDRPDYHEPLIYASNHRSNLDPPVVGSTVDREVYFVAKRSLFNNAFLGAIIRYLNSVPINRNRFDRETMDRFVELLKSERSVLIFPEGGRVDGDGLGKARPGVGYLALNSGRPVIPVYVSGTHKLRKALVRRPPFSIVMGKPIRLTDNDLSKYNTPDQLRDYSNMVLTAIAALKDEVERGGS